MRPVAPCAPPRPLAAGVAHRLPADRRLVVVLSMLLGVAALGGLELAGADAPAGTVYETLFTAVPASEWADPLTSEEPEPDFCIDVIDVPELGGTVLLPNTQPGDPAHAATRPELARNLFASVVLENPGLLQDLHVEGTLAALEFTWCPSPLSPAAPAEHLGVMGEVYAPDVWGVPAFTAWVYAYTPEQLQERLALLLAAGSP